jgi:ribonuclease P protein component
MVYIASPAENAGSVLQFGVSVSKKYFKKAVHRNRIKRLIREAYRIQKLPLQQLLKDRAKPLQLFIIYTGKELPDYNLIYTKVAEALKRLQKTIVHTP